VLIISAYRMMKGMPPGTTILSYRRDQIVNYLFSDDPDITIDLGASTAG
jgi:hypothetical protein